MANSEFTNIDFGFRYGTTKAINSTSVLNGTFNIATDTGELYIDVDGSRIPMNKDINIYNTEAEIKAIVNPYSGKLYYAKDTYKLFAYDSENLKWINAGGSPDEVNARIDALTNVVNAIYSFEIVILNEGESLPETGESHIIYFVPQENSDEDTLYDEFVWIESEEYYEKIGISAPDLANYYTKTEVDATVTNINTNISNLGTTVANNKSAIEGTVSDLTDTVAANKTAIESTVSDLTDTVAANKSAIEGTVSDLTDTVAANKSAIESTVSDLTDTVAANKTAIEGTVSDLADTVADNYTTLDTKIDSIGGGAAPTSHAVADTTYGGSTETLYGHSKLSDTYNSEVGAAADSIGASQKALYDAFIALTQSISTATTSLEEVIATTVADLDYGDEDADVTPESDPENTEGE